MIAIGAKADIERLDPEMVPRRRGEGGGPSLLFQRKHLLAVRIFSGLLI
jgi:hypothetical protein